MIVVITLHSQTELAINTHTTVSGTHTVVSNTRTVVSNTHTMVSDIHRTIVHGQEGNDNKVSVGDVRTSASPNDYRSFHRLKPVEHPCLRH